MSILPATTTQWLVRYQQPIVFGTLAIYEVLIAMHYALVAQWLPAGVSLAIGLWFLGFVEDTLQSRKRIEAAALALYEMLQAYREQGYDEEAADADALLIKERSGTWFDISIGAFWYGMGMMGIYTSKWHILEIIAGSLITTMGLLVIYTARSPDYLVPKLVPNLGKSC
jgi:hypothetical protein